MIIPDGIRYKNGKVFSPNGNVVIDFAEDLNPALADVFIDLPGLVGKEADISGLPDEFVIDGVTYEINRDDERPEIEAIIADIQAAFDLPTAQHARAAARIMWRIARRF